MRLCAGKAELLGWGAAVARAVRDGACGAYHGRREAALAALYKGAVFTVRAKAYQATGRYHADCAALRQDVQGADRAVVERALAYRKGRRAALRRTPWRSSLGPRGSLPGKGRA